MSENERLALMIERCEAIALEERTGRLAAEARAQEAEADRDRLTRQHAECDDKIRTLTSKALAAVRGHEAAEARTQEAERELAVWKPRPTESGALAADSVEEGRRLELPGAELPAAMYLRGLVYRLVGAYDRVEMRRRAGAAARVRLVIRAKAAEARAEGLAVRLSDAEVVIRRITENHFARISERGLLVYGQPVAETGFVEALAWLAEVEKEARP